MYTDPIADLLTRIRNASRAHHNELNVPYSKFKASILEIMKKNGYIEDYKKEKSGNHDELKIELKENNAEITMKRISKPGQRIYVKNTELKPIKSGIGLSIISTSKGLMTNSEAKKQIAIYGSHLVKEPNHVYDQERTSGNNR